ncbi:hypothetical protein Fmac_001620 [Flemingia macrophylla]|uniref:Uncharacterized protein n=1 Tax=Flemingia macrophylla TaxID=520843 RepID=A0ABD1NHM9_9FABA
MVAGEPFGVGIPNRLPLDVVAPLLCAGIRMYGLLRYFGLDKPGMHLGVVGHGELGHLAVVCKSPRLEGHCHQYLSW